jgi:hypothetical protein
MRHTNSQFHAATSAEHAMGPFPAVGAFPVFLGFNSGVHAFTTMPDLDDHNPPRWDPAQIDTSMSPGGWGQSMLKQVQWSRDFFTHRHTVGDVTYLGSGKHGAVRHRVEKLVGVPRGREWTRLRFSIADHAGDNQVGVVEHCPEGVARGVPELATFVHRAGRGGTDMTGDAARKRELPHQLAQPINVLADVGVDLAVGALEAGTRDERRVQARRCTACSGRTP